MNKHKKIFLSILFAIFATSFFVNTAKATMPIIYPVWGYSEQSHICQIKQESEESLPNEQLGGQYSSIHECRSANPEIIFYTGEGILIWLAILLTIILNNFILLPKAKNRTHTENTVFFLRDVAGIGIILFFVVLLQHYYNIPRAFYNYTSDIDHIIYSTFIRSEVPAMFATGYLLLIVVQFIFHYNKNRKRF